MPNVSGLWRARRSVGTDHCVDVRVGLGASAVVSILAVPRLLREPLVEEARIVFEPSQAAELDESDDAVRNMNS